MAVLDPIKPTILAVRIIPNIDRGLAAKIGLADHHRAVGLITCDIDDALYVSLDEATKMAEVDVVYAKSFYAGSAHASGPLSGEIIGMLAGPSTAEVRAGVDACVAYAEAEAWFYSANADGSLAFFPHLISATGSYLSDAAGVDVSLHSADGTPRGSGRTDADGRLALGPDVLEPGDYALTFATGDH